jgi:uncharacterized protein involved in exopolysaccharide biosynthesis
MFDLDRELAKWRREMGAAGLKSPDIIRELEEHLRDDIEQQVRSGISLPEALQAALQRIGQPRLLTKEFEMINETGVRAVLRRHKWKMVVCAGAAVVSAFVLHVLRPPPYQSEAKVLIRYVIADDASSEPRFVQPLDATSEKRTEAVLNVQADILTSSELARRVAEKIGPDKLLAKAGGGNDLAAAVALVKRGLLVEMRPKSIVILIAFRHPNSDVVQPVLREVIDQFLRMHVETFRGAGGPTVAFGRVTNISQIQPPSPPFFDRAASYRMLATVIVGAVLAGLAWVLIVRLHSTYSERHLRGMG